MNLAFLPAYFWQFKVIEQGLYTKLVVLVFPFLVAKKAVFLDLSKAFDRVWHEGLLYKLECNSITGNLLALIRDYLANRKQRVVLNGKSSEWATISAGVPQGSVLGPLFFLVYINDLVDNVNCDIKMFADDTSLFSRVDDPVRSALKLNEDLDTVKLWALQWKMHLMLIKLKKSYTLAKGSNQTTHLYC